MVGEVVGRALLWLSLPLYLFPSLDPGRAGHRRVDHRRPRHRRRSAWSSSRARAIGWMSAFTAGLCGAMFIGRNTVPFQHMLSILFTLGVAIFGVLTVARWAFEQLKTNADFGAAERKRQPAAAGI